MSDFHKSVEELTRLAMKGLMTGALVASGSVLAAPNAEPVHAEPGYVWSADEKYKEVHSCAGLNVCKGLGGCKVSAELLKKLASDRGIPLEKAGQPHDCAGKNECKGLGGCHVSEAKFAKLKAKLEANAKYKEVHSCAGLNVCKGLGGCKVSAELLKKLAADRGIPLEEAGQPHSCAGKNECKGLGGCHVSEAKFAKLKKKLAEKAEKKDN